MNNLTKTDKIFMAFGTGASTETVEFKKYIGIGACSILAINPTKEELSKIYGRPIEKDPQYVGTTTVDDKEVPQARIDIIVKTNPDKCNGIDMIKTLSFFIDKNYQFSSNKASVKVINKYAETSYMPVDAVKSGNVPENMKWFDTTGMKPAYRGEEELTLFIKAYLAIPGRQRMNDNGEWVAIDDLSRAYAQLENVDEYFKGNVQEIKDVIAFQPKNNVKVLFGVKSKDGKEYQDAYTKFFMSARSTNTQKLKKSVDEFQANGGMPNTTFEICDIKEYKLEATDLSQDFNNDSTFGTSNDDAWPF